MEKQNDCVIAPLYVIGALRRHFSTADVVAGTTNTVRTGKRAFPFPIDRPYEISMLSRFPREIY